MVISYNIDEANDVNQRNLDRNYNDGLKTIIYFVEIYIWISQ
jgi:hypothetical protein